MRACLCVFNSSRGGADMNLSPSLFCARAHTPPHALLLHSHTHTHTHACTHQAAFDKVAGRWLVGPIVWSLVFKNVAPSVAAWADEVCRSRLALRVHARMRTRVLTHAHTHTHKHKHKHTHKHTRAYTHRCASGTSPTSCRATSRGPSGRRPRSSGRRSTSLTPARSPGREDAFVRGDARA